MFKIDERVHEAKELKQWLIDNKKKFKTAKRKKTKHRDSCTYYNIPAAFDIETSTFFIDNKGNQFSQEDYEKMVMSRDPKVDDLEARAILVSWQIGINGTGFIGRTWEELSEAFVTIASELRLDEDLKLIMYVHNLAYEFQFVRKRIYVEDVFSVDRRKPIHCSSIYNIEFKDSLILSGMSLESTAKNLTKYKVLKQTGWDYKKVRHSGTPLTEDEKKYALFDVLVVMAFIQEKIEDEQYVFNIPLTNTGYVRRFCRKNTIQNPDKKTAEEYKKLMKALKIKDSKEYFQLKQTFQGGFTHANATEVNKTHKDVRSYDLTSDYPSQMMMNKFPMGRAPNVKISNWKQFQTQLDNYCCMFAVTLYDVKQKECVYENIISKSKCVILESPVINNGRVVSADKLKIYVTDVDWRMIEKFYDFNKKKIGISEFVRYYKEYLPTPLMDAVLSLYEDKTKLKGDSDMIVEYMKSKGMLNSSYGMMVTDIINEILEYDEGLKEWSDPQKPADLEAEIEKYNESLSRFLYYPWGVWVTAYARETLQNAILACGKYYIYSDTDSIKFLKDGSEEFEKYIKKCNQIVEKRMERACKHHGFSVDRVNPETIKHEKKLLGEWDFDGDYIEFKTLGAKRYCYTQKNKKTCEVFFETTVAGSNKKKLPEYILSKTNNPFDMFNDKLVVPPTHSGRNVVEYIDDEFFGYVTDYKGIREYYNEKSAAAIMSTTFTMNISDEYLNYINSIRMDFTI